MTKIFSIALFLLAIQAYGQSNLNIRFQPHKSVYLYQVNDGNPKEIYDVVIQNIAIVNNTEETLSVDNITLSVFKDSLEIQSITIHKNRLTECAERMNAFQEKGLIDMLDFQFQTSSYLKNVSFPPTRKIVENEAVVVSRIPLLFDNIPDSIVVSVNSYNKKNELVIAKNKLDIIKYASKNNYHFPLSRAVV